jgi:hypothetical protein
MRAPPATNNELFAVLGVAAFVAAAILYWQTPKQAPVQPVVVVQPQPQVVTTPAKWGLGGVGPGWASGRWLGEGDFVHHGQMDHPFRDQPHHSGHPLPPPTLPQAPSYR